MRRGFTLIEIIVVLGIFGILMLVAADFFINTLKNSNRISTQTEVRQNAQKIMQDIVAEMRRSDTYTIVDVPPNQGDLITTSASGTTTYHVDTTTWVLTKNKIPLNSDAVIIKDCGGVNCGIGCSAQRNYINWTSVWGEHLTSALSINLVVQQKSGENNSAYCARTTLIDTATPRQY